MAEAIVGRAFVGIHQDVIGFAEFLEFLLGVRVVRVFVRMKFDRELAIRALDFFRRTLRVRRRGLRSNRAS